MVKLKKKRLSLWEFPGGPVVRIYHFHCHGQVQSLVRELRSLQAKWSSQKANKQKRSNNFLKRPPVSWLRYQLSPSWPSGHVAVTQLCSDLPLNSPASPGFYSFALLSSLSTGPSSSSSPGPFPALPRFPCHSEVGRRQLGIIALRKSALGIHSPSKSSTFCPFYLQ